jgi:hypothetical protein
MPLLPNKSHLSHQIEIKCESLKINLRLYQFHWVCWWLTLEGSQQSLKSWKFELFRFFFLSLSFEVLKAKNLHSASKVAAWRFFTLTLMTDLLVHLSCFLALTWFSLKYFWDPFSVLQSLRPECLTRLMSTCLHNYAAHSYEWIEMENEFMALGWQIYVESLKWNLWWRQKAKDHQQPVALFSSECRSQAKCCHEILNCNPPVTTQTPAWIFRFYFVEHKLSTENFLLMLRIWEQGKEGKAQGESRSLCQVCTFIAIFDCVSTLKDGNWFNCTKRNEDN